ncbi:Aste57867_3968 [Aphanomyces stellatus]|uniref:Aste57867_3968 protein n=1 Tax=Aphanomyces stellatus TaxID=120398 RepID=A0A485KAQ0_9STRA|nr:hypothetical protein As57867_003957 [Aphanomyces stellatus]VFT81105.1 Aste57867_3968 [Aphanomyces stellatus]
MSAGSASPGDHPRSRRQHAKPNSMDLSRNEVVSTAQAFIQAVHDGSKQVVKNNTLADLKAGCRSMQFVAHLQSAPVYTPVLDTVCTQCFGGEATMDMKDDMVALVYDLVRGAPIGYPSPPLAKVLSALVHTVVREIVHDENTELEDLSFLLHLQTLSASLHGNIGVRLYVSELPERKELVRTLALLLNRTEDVGVLIFTMSILARLVLHEPVGRKLFQPKNVEHALELVASVVGDKDTSTLLSMDNTSTRERVHLQLASIDLVVDLASQPWVLAIVEGSDDFAHLVQTMLGRVHMNETALRLQVALHFLQAVSQLSHRLRKEMGRTFPPLSRALPVVLHPMPLVAIVAAKFYVSFLSEDKAMVEAQISRTCSSVAQDEANNSSSNQPSEKLIAPLQPVLIGLFRTLHSTITLLVRRDGQFDDCADEYDHAVLICQLLVRLSSDARVWTLSLPLVNLSQMVGLTQREVQFMNALPPEDFIRYTPRFALAFMTLVGTLMLHDDVDDNQLREFNHVLTQPDVASLLSRGLCQSEDKQWTLDVLTFLRRFLSQSKSFHERASLLTLADTLFTTNHKVQEVVAMWSTRLSQSDTALHMAQKQTEMLRKELELVKTNAADERLQLHTEAARLQKELDVQKSTHVQVLEAVTAKCEGQLGHLKAQCDGLYAQVQEKTVAVEKKQRQLQESRVHRCTLEEENNGLKRKLLVLEMRIDEVAEAQATARHEADAIERDKQRIQTELETLSEAYAEQGGELLAAQDMCHTFKRSLHEQEEKAELAYKQLVLLSKAHQMQSEELVRTTDERDHATRDLREARVAIDGLHAQAADQDTRIHTHKEHIAELEGVVRRGELSLQEEKTQGHVLRNDLETLRHHHVNLQNDLAARDTRVFDLQRLHDATQKALAQRDMEVQRLKTELKKYAKIQAMIHQLSDGAALTTTSLSQQSNGGGGSSQESNHGFVPETQFSE